MRLADLRAVMAIESTAFPVPWKASAYEYEITKNRLASYQVLTASQGDQPTEIIGYVGCWLMAGEAHVSTIAVHSKWRGRGLGELLLLNALVISYGASAQLATLEVRRSNIVAQALYRKYLFQIVGERRRYYQGREDAVIMTVDPLDGTYRSHLRRLQHALFERLQSARLREIGR